MTTPVSYLDWNNPTLAAIYDAHHDVVFPPNPVTAASFERAIWDGGVTDGLGVAAAVTSTYGLATGNPEASVAGGFLGIAAAVSAGFDSGTFGMGGQSVTSAPDGFGIGPGPNGANNGDGSPY